jgi:putative hydrolase of the HAD superfamily
LSLASPAAILLDLDNTVYPYAPCHAAGLAAAHAFAATLHPRWAEVAVFHAAYRAARAVVKDRTHGQAAAHSRLLYFKQMLDTDGVADLSALRQLDHAYWRGYFDQMRTDPGCLDTLQVLRAAGLRLAWVTNFTTERQMLKLTALGLDNLAHCLVTSEEAGAEKPDPRPMHLALDRLGVMPAQAWLVGDDLARDVGAARAAGVAAIWLRRELGQPLPSASVPDAVVDDWPAFQGLWESVARG